MTFLWSRFLYLLALIPAVIGVYVWILHRRGRFAVHYSSLALLRDALPRQSSWRRHLPFGLFMIAMASLVVALSRPESTVTVPEKLSTIILTIDVSRSMCSTDIQPNRLQAAEAAVLTFIKDQKPTTRIGIVAFSGFAELIQAPTTNQDALQAAVQSLLTGESTAIGSGILKSLDAIAEADKKVKPSVPDTSSKLTPAPFPIGTYAPDIIVLLTDGVSNTGPLPSDAAQQAVDRGVRVFTIGFGTAHGSQFASCQSSDHSEFGRFASEGSGGSIGREIDDLALERIADMTGGVYFPAASASELESIFKWLPTYLVAQHERSELSVFFAAGGALLSALAFALSLLWHPLT